MQHRWQFFLIQLCALCMFASSGYAVSLGKIQVNSHLGEYFDAEIPLHLSGHENVNDILIEMASPADYRILEVYREAELNAIRLDVKNVGQYEKIVLNSTSVLNAPFFNIVLKIRLGRATHFKKYAVFIDPANANQGFNAAPKETVNAAWVEKKATPVAVAPVMPVMPMAMPALNLPSVSATLPKNEFTKENYAPVVASQAYLKTKNVLNDTQAPIEKSVVTNKAEGVMLPSEKDNVFAKQPTPIAALPHEERFRKSEAAIALIDPFAGIFNEDFVTKKNVYKENLTTPNTIDVTPAEAYQPIAPVQAKAPVYVRNPVQVRAPTNARNINAYGPVRKGETLSMVARAAQHQYTQSLTQIMVAIYKRNPDAFNQSNMNVLKVGSVLTIPTQSEVSAITANQAKNMIQQHNEHWVTPMLASGRKSFIKKVVVAAGAVESTVPRSDKAVVIAATQSADSYALIEENKFLKNELEQAHSTIKELNHDPLRLELQAATAELEKLSLTIIELKKQLQQASQSSQDTAYPAYLLWVLIGTAVLILILIIVIVVLMRKQAGPAHPMSSSKEDESESLLSKEKVAAATAVAAVTAATAVTAEEETKYDVNDAPEISEFDFPDESTTDSLSTDGIDDMQHMSFDGDVSTASKLETSDMDFSNFDNELDGQMPDITDEDTSEIEAFQDEIEDEPDPNVDYLAEADVYQRYGMDDEAIHQMRMAIRQRPNNVEAHIKLVQSLHASGNTNEMENAAQAARSALAGANLEKYESTVNGLDAASGASETSDIGISTGSFESDGSFDDLTATVSMNVSDIQKQTDLLTEQAEKADKESVDLNDYGFSSASSDDIDIDFSSQELGSSSTLEDNDTDLDFSNLDLGDNLSGSNELDFSTGLDLGSFEEAEDELKDDDTLVQTGELDFGLDLSNSDKPVSLDTNTDMAIDFSDSLNFDLGSAADAANDTETEESTASDFDIEAIETVSSLDFDFETLTSDLDQKSDNEGVESEVKKNDDLSAITSTSAEESVQGLSLDFNLDEEADDLAALDLGDDKTFELGLSDDLTATDAGDDLAALDLGDDKTFELGLSDDLTATDAGDDLAALDLGDDDKAFELGLSDDLAATDAGDDLAALDLGDDDKVFSLSLSDDLAATDAGDDFANLDLGDDDKVFSLRLPDDLAATDAGDDLAALDLGDDAKEFSLSLSDDLAATDAGDDLAALDLGDDTDFSLSLSDDLAATDAGDDLAALDLGDDDKVFSLSLSDDLAATDADDEFSALDLGDDDKEFNLSLSDDLLTADAGDDLAALDLGDDTDFSLSLSDDLAATDADDEFSALDLGNDDKEFNLSLSDDLAATDSGDDLAALDLGDDAKEFSLSLSDDLAATDAGDDLAALDLGDDAKEFSLSLSDDLAATDAGDDLAALDLGDDTDFSLSLSDDLAATDAGDDLTALDLGDDTDFNLSLSDDLAATDAGDDLTALDLGDDTDFSLSLSDDLAATDAGDDLTALDLGDDTDFNLSLSDDLAATDAGDDLAALDLGDDDKDFNLSLSDDLATADASDDFAALDLGDDAKEFSLSLSDDLLTADASDDFANLDLGDDDALSALDNFVSDSVEPQLSGSVDDLMEGLQSDVDFLGSHDDEALDVSLFDDLNTSEDLIPSSAAQQVMLVPEGTESSTSDFDLSGLSAMSGSDDDVTYDVFVDDLNSLSVDTEDDSIANLSESQVDTDAKDDDILADFDFSLDEISDEIETSSDTGYDLSSLAAVDELNDTETLDSLLELGEEIQTEEVENEEIYNLLDTLSGGHVEQEMFGHARDESEKLKELNDLSKLGLDALSIDDASSEVSDNQDKDIDDSFSLTQELDDLLHSFDDSSHSQATDMNYDHILSDSSLHLDSARSYLAQADFDEAKKEFELASSDPETRDEALLGLSEIARLEGGSVSFMAQDDVQPLQAAEDHFTTVQMKVDMILAEAGEGESLESLAEKAEMNGDLVGANEYNHLAEDLMEAMQAFEDAREEAEK